MTFIPISFHIIKPRNNKILNIGFLSFLALAFILKIILDTGSIEKSKELFFFLIAIPIILYININYIRRPFLKTNNKIKFGNEAITLTINNQNNYLQVNNISYVKIHIESYDQGMPLTITDYKLNHKRGNGNKILIKTKEKSYEYKFYINDKNDILHLLKAIHTLQKEGLNIEYSKSKYINN